MKNIPKFQNEQKERAFWEKNDTTEYINWESAKTTSLPNLKKSTKTISLRLPADMLEKIKTKANSLDVPYQSLIKVMLQKELASEGM